MGLRSFSSETSREGPITRLRPVLAAANLSPRRLDCGALPALVTLGLDRIPASDAAKEAVHPALARPGAAAAAPS